MASEIRDFSKPNPQPEGERVGDVQILRGTQRGVEIQRLSALTGVEQEGGLEIRVHEEIITQDDKLRGRKLQPGETEIRIRHGDPKAWEDVKRGDEDA